MAFRADGVAIFVGVVVGLELVLFIYARRVDRWDQHHPDDQPGAVFYPAWVGHFPRIWFWAHIPGIAATALPLAIFMLATKRRNAAIPRFATQVPNVVTLYAAAVLLRWYASWV